MRPFVVLLKRIVRQTSRPGISRALCTHFAWPEEGLDALLAGSLDDEIRLILRIGESSAAGRVGACVR
jgi:hypothetical protein